MVKINDWEYSVIREDDGCLPQYVVTPKKPVPGTLSKYYALNGNNVSAFINRHFYVSESLELNDIFDALILLIKMDKIPVEDLRNYIRERQEHIQYIQDICNIENIDLNDNKIRDKLLRCLRGIFHLNFSTSNGILSMTESHDNDLVWAHYTQNKGFLVEYDIEQFDKDCFQGPFPINYIPEIKPFEADCIENLEAVYLASFLTKLDIWDYEQEFRFLCNPKEEKKRFKTKLAHDPEFIDRFVSYPQGAIKKNVLGFGFYADDVKKEINSHEHELLFTGEEGVLKSTLFNDIIKHEIPVEIIAINQEKFKIEPMPLIIEPLGGTRYKAYPKINKSLNKNLPYR